jgi:small-conductance mechanosensitive channel
MLLEPFFTGNTRLLLEKIIYVLIIVVIASVIAKMIATATTRLGNEAGISRNITSLINKVITYFIAFISLVLIVQIFNFDVATFVASFGIVGLIVGIGAQAVISNFISGILIMFEKPFVIGDFIEITGLQGKVEDVRLRSTSIKTFDGRVITVPNSTFTSNAIINYSRTGEIQVKIPVSFKADVDIEKVSQVMSSVAKSTHGVRPYRIETLVTGITQGDTSWNIEVELRFWVNQFSDRDVIISNVTGRIKEELAKEKTISVLPPKKD